MKFGARIRHGNGKVSLFHFSGLSQKIQRRMDRLAGFPGKPIMTEFKASTPYLLQMLFPLT